MTRPFELLETMRWVPPDGWYLLVRHLARLEDSARHFGFKCQAVEIRAALDRAERLAAGPLRVRLLLAEDGGVRVEHAPLHLPDGASAAMRVRFALDPIDPSDAFLFHKTTNRVVYERAVRPDCDDVVLWNPAGEVTDTTIANLVVDIDGVDDAGGGVARGRRVTPPVACGLLPGTFRAELLETGVVSEARVTIEQLRRAPRFWLVNSVRGWCRAELLD